MSDVREPRHAGAEPIDLAEISSMMAATFATLFAALVASGLARTRLAAWLIVSTFALAVGLFLYEVYSPEYGFRMPWIQTELAPGGAHARRG